MILFDRLEVFNVYASVFFHRRFHIEFFFMALLRHNSSKDHAAQVGGDSVRTVNTEIVRSYGQKVLDPRASNCRDCQFLPDST